MGKKIIVAVTGASGSIYAKRLLVKLDILRNQTDSIAVIFSNTAQKVWKYELNEEINVPAFFQTYTPENLFAPPASGSAGYTSMIICPSSMGTIGRIASGLANDLICRAADVMLKERRQLIIVPRETPLSLIHINNLKLVTEAGAIICPAMPSFYSHPQSINELVDTVIERILTLAGFTFNSFEWGKES